MIKKIYPSQDAYISELYENFNFANAERLYLGCDSNKFINRCLFNFNISSIPQNIEIKNAYIAFFVLDKQGADQEVFLYTADKNVNLQYVSYNLEPKVTKTKHTSKIYDSSIKTFVNIDITDILQNKLSSHENFVDVELRGDENILSLIEIAGYTYDIDVKVPFLLVEYSEKPQDFEIISNTTSLYNEKLSTTYSVKNNGTKESLAILQLKLKDNSEWADEKSETVSLGITKVISTNSSNFENRISIVNIMLQQIATSQQIINVNDNISNTNNISLYYASSDQNAVIDSKGYVTFGTGKITTTITIKAKNIKSDEGISFIINSNVQTKGVKNEAELLSALSDESIGYIEFANSIVLTNPLIISRNITINAQSYTLSFDLPVTDKSVTIKCKSISLSNIIVAGRINIDSGNDSSVYFNRVDVSVTDGIHILSGSYNSVKFYGVDATDLYIEWYMKVILDADTSGSNPKPTDIDEIHINYPPSASASAVLELPCATVKKIEAESPMMLNLENATKVTEINVELEAVGTVIDDNSTMNPTINIKAEDTTLSGSGEPIINVDPSVKKITVEGCIINDKTATVSNSMGLHYALSDTNINEINLQPGTYYEDFFYITRPLKVHGSNYRDEHGNYITQTIITVKNADSSIIIASEGENTDISWVTFDRAGIAATAVVFYGQSLPNNGSVTNCKVMGNVGNAASNHFCALLALNGAESIVFSNNIVEGMLSGGYAAAIGAIWGCNDIYIVNNYIDGLGVIGNGIEGIVLSGVTILNNEIKNCNNCGIYENQSSLKIESNTIYNNNYGVCAGAHTHSMRKNTIYNNTFAVSGSNSFDGAKNYYGTSSPKSSMFEGDVIYSPYYIDSLMTILSIAVNEIIVTGKNGALSVPINGTLEMLAEILPQNATVKNITWSVKSKDGHGKASIDTNGVLKGEALGIVTVNAFADDGSRVSGNIDITVVS